MPQSSDSGILELRSQFTPSETPSEKVLPLFTQTHVSVAPQRVEIHLPPLIAGAVAFGFAAILADKLGNELLVHYYTDSNRLRVNLDRVVDRLLIRFIDSFLDDVRRFYVNAHGLTEQVQKLFDGPVRQISLILGGPEVATCLLDHIAPGLSRRTRSWTRDTKGIDLQLALQLLCNFWHANFPLHSPGGSPRNIADTIYAALTLGDATSALISSLRQSLMTPHHVQMHALESAMWDMALASSRRPPADGFHQAQLSFECSIFGPLEAIGDAELVRLKNLPTLTGTATECGKATVREYVQKNWPRCGPLVLNQLEEALLSATRSHLEGGAFGGMAVWEGTHTSLGLRLMHVEIENASIVLSVSAKVLVLIELFQQLSWLCAALSSSPFTGALSECAVEPSSWGYMDEATPSTDSAGSLSALTSTRRDMNSRINQGSLYVNCSLMHRPVSEGSYPPWLRELQGATVATGFPPHHFEQYQSP